MGLRAKYAVVVAMGLLGCGAPAPPVATVAMAPVVEPTAKAASIEPEAPKAGLQVAAVFSTQKAISRSIK